MKEYKRGGVSVRDSPRYIHNLPTRFLYLINIYCRLEKVLITDLRPLFAVTGTETFGISYRAFTGQCCSGRFVAGASGTFF